MKDDTGKRIGASRVSVPGLIPIFPTPILVTKYASSFEDEFKFIKGLKYTEQEENRNFRSDDTYLLKREELSKIKDFFYESINRYTQQIWMTNQKLIITQCWTNKNPPQSVHHEHVHANSVLSGVFYFRQIKTLPPIQFQKTVNDPISLNPERYNSVNSDTFLLPLVDGELVLFPSNIRHSVPINKGNETRYSMSFNTFCVEELGNKNNLTHLDIKGLTSILY
jgi:uncharacterized protein (TIGR02466 family)|tara:strand:+ start:16 stop:684 length:669 start_codon:yes stop_codon:yes gene_type:complete